MIRAGIEAVGVRLGGVVVLGLGVVGCVLAMTALALAWVISPKWVMDALCDTLPEEDAGDHEGYDHGLGERHR